MANNKAVTAAPSSGPNMMKMTPENTSMHILRKMGINTELDRGIASNGGKKTPA